MCSSKEAVCVKDGEYMAKKAAAGFENMVKRIQNEKKNNQKTEVDHLA